MRSAILLILCGLSAFGQFPNILISSQFEPKGVSIAINPKNSSQIIAGAGLANAYFSGDGGHTWEKNDLICEAYNLYGEPRVFWDTARKAYYSDLAFLNPKVVTDGSWVDRVIVHRSDSFGRKYSNCEDFGKNGKKVQYRQGFSVDPQTNTIYAVWTQFSKFESTQSTDTTVVLACKSMDGGRRWSDAKKLNKHTGNCSNSDSTLMGAVTCVGPGGDVFAAWAGPKGIMFQKSWNDGGSWLPEEKTVASIKNGWHYSVNGIYRANGLPSMVCDLSSGAHRGRIYICWSDEKNGTLNKDVFIIYSDDKGETWSDQIIVTYYPNHKEQFMPAMTIDQSNGNLHILYYDQQNYAEEGMTDVYMAVSKNGGQKFDYYKVNEKSFKPNKGGTFGDYIDISASNNVVRPVWMQQDKKNQLNVYTAIIDDKAMQSYYADKASEIALDKSFKFAEETKITFDLKAPGEITAVITKPLEPGFEKTVFKNKKFKAGNNALLIKSKELGLQKGTHILTLYYRGKNTYCWIVEE